MYQALATVPGLKRGRCEARETDPVKPVPQHHIDAILPHVSRHVGAMIRLQLVAGMRPGEVCSMTTGAIDRPGPVWVYRPANHKTLHHGHTREIRLGPKSQAIITPFLRLDPDAALFSPAEAEAERRATVSAERKTPLHYGNRPGTNRRRKPQRVPGDAYDRESYRRAIARACQKMDRQAHKVDPTVPADQVVVPTWHPHQLRHNAATGLRKRFGVKVARVILGHRSAAITEVYAEMDVEKAARVMSEVG